MQPCALRVAAFLFKGTTCTYLFPALTTHRSPLHPAVFPHFATVYLQFIAIIFEIYTFGKQMLPM